MIQRFVSPYTLTQGISKRLFFHEKKPSNNFRLFLQIYMEQLDAQVNLTECRLRIV